MTEAEWLSSADPTPMLESLQSEASNRKLRLFAVACCRRISYLLDEDVGLPAVDMTERCAEGMISVDELWQKRNEIADDDELYSRIAASSGRSREVVSSAFYALGLMMGMMGWRQASSAVEAIANTVAVLGLGNIADRFAYEEQEEYEEAAKPFKDVEKLAQRVILHDIFGNPFRPVTADPRWLTSTAVALATGIYEERAFDRMPILADALEDAGCDNPDILSHCRGAGPHVRGCWVVDLVLGKS